MLKAFVSKDEFSGLDENIQGFYVESKDGYLLQVAKVGNFELADVANLKSALQKERQRASELEKGIKEVESKFEGIDDPERALEALGKLDEIANYDPDKKLEEAKKQFQEQIESKYRKEMESIKNKLTNEIKVNTTKLSAREAQLAEALINMQANNILANPDIKGNPALLMPVIKQHVRMREEGDRFVPEIIDENGQPLMSTVTSSTDPMNLQEFVETLKTDSRYAGAFEGINAAGSGGAGGGNPPKVTDSKTLVANNGFLTVDDNDLENISTGKAEVDFD